MKLFYHYCPAGFSNCYILGTDFPDPGAIIIDPGIMDSEILSIIEDNNLSINGIFITHDHSHHVRGLKTFMRIYNAEIFAVNPVVLEQKTTIVKDGDQINIGSIRIEVISVPGHSADSAVFKIGRFLFTGDAMSAGLVGSTASSYATMTQERALRSKIFSMPGDYTILPGHGPPSSLEAERRFNYGLHTNEKFNNTRQIIDFTD